MELLGDVEGGEAYSTQSETPQDRLTGLAVQKGFSSGYCRLFMLSGKYLGALTASLRRLDTPNFLNR